MDLSLKLLGDIQVYDIPYLSLYIDEVSHSFYLAFLMSFQKGSFAEFAVAPVRPEKLLDYLHQQITIKDMYGDSAFLYVWHKQKGNNSFLRLINKNDIESKVENLKYNPFLCEDEELILDYLQGE